MALYSNTLAVLRKYLSSAVGDLIEGTADSGTSATLVSTMLRQADDYYNNFKYRCYIYAGTNLGEEREVSDWTLTSPANTLTLAPAYTAPIDNTSKYELHRIFTEDEYRKAINLAIEALADGKYLIDKIDATIVLVADTYEYTLPTDIYYVHKITTEKTAAGGVFDDSDVIDPRDWRLISSRKLKLHEDYYSPSAGKDLRIEGQGRQDALIVDTSVCYLPVGWVVQKAITLLPLSKIESNKLDAVYNRAMLLSAKEPRNSPHPEARRVVE